MAQNIVITMAGRGSRFYEAGYTVPKYEIMAHGRSLFEWSMLSIRNFLDADSRVIFVCLAENKSADYVNKQCRILGLENVCVVELNQITDGQATSAYVCRDLWRQDLPLLIYNIDTYVNPRVLRPEDIRVGSDGWVPCFRVPGDHWSFVKLGLDGWAVDIAEKRRISDLASIGLYWFARADQYITAYDTFFLDPNNLVRGERYIAPLYKHLIQVGCHVSVAELPEREVNVLGTPAELQIFMDKTMFAQLDNRYE